MTQSTIRDAKEIKVVAKGSAGSEIPAGTNKVMMGLVFYLDKDEPFSPLFDRMQKMLMDHEGVTLVTAIHQTEQGPVL